MTPGPDVSVRRARTDDAPRVLAVLDEAAAWLAGRGVVQWPSAFRVEWLQPALGAGRVWLAEFAGSPVGTLTLALDDPLWPDDGRATYLHRFAVTRGRAGLGTALLGWADDRTRTDGRDLLRLDCDAANTALRRYYEAAGFAHRGDVEVGSENLRWSRGPLLLSRYQRRTAPPELQ